MEDEHAQVSSVVNTRIEIPGTTSVPSEMLFSTAGDIISDLRCHLLPKNADRDIDLLEAQPPLLGRVTFQLVV